MTRRVLALAAIGAVATAAAAARAPTATGPGLIRVAAVEKRLVRVDVAPKGLSPGDREIVTQLIYNRRITPKPIGSAEYVCTFTVGRTRSCQGTYSLPRGQIVVAGSARYRELYELAILGGTGLYNNARGTLTSTRVGEPTAKREYLVFRLAG